SRRSVPGLPEGRRLDRARPFPGGSPRLHRAAECGRRQGGRADARLHRPGARAMKPLAIVLLGLVLAPGLAAGATPDGQITWAVHTTLVPTYFDPAETTIITSVMVLYALYDR